MALYYKSLQLYKSMKTLLGMMMVDKDRLEVDIKEDTDPLFEYSCFLHLCVLVAAYAFDGA